MSLDCRVASVTNESEYAEWARFRVEELCNRCLVKPTEELVEEISRQLPSFDRASDWWLYELDWEIYKLLADYMPAEERDRLEV